MLDTNQYRNTQGSGTLERVEEMSRNNVTSPELTAHIKPHVLSIIPRGEVVRNFVYSGCLDFLSKETDLSLLSISVSSEFVDVLEGPNRAVFALEEVQERWVVRFQREVLDLAHGRWLWSKAAQERWRLRNHEARSFRQKVVRKAKKSIAIPFANDWGLKFLSIIERTSSRLLNPTDRFIDLYKTTKPTLVFNGSHIHSAIATPAVQAAQWLGIPTATFIFSWDNLTSQGRIMLPYDYFLVWNDSLKEQLLKIYSWIKPENVLVTGTPQFDLHFQRDFYWDRKRFCDEIGADAKRPIILYSTGMANHMPGEPEIVEGIADMLRDYEGEERPQLLVRVYAKDLTNRFDDLEHRRKDIIFQKTLWDPVWLTPKYDDAYILINTLRHCSMGINIASTISLELCMFDKPVVNVGYDPPTGNDLGLSNARFYSFEHYKPVVDSGAVKVAMSNAEMRNMIAEGLRNPSERAAKRRRLINKMFHDTLDGKSAKRVSDVLSRLAGN